MALQIPSKIRLGIVFTFPISRTRRNFLTHIPIRTKELLGESVEVYVIYMGYLNRSILAKRGIHCLPMWGFKNSRVLNILNPFLLFFYTAVYVRKHSLDVVMNANNHKWMLPVALASRLSRKKSVARVTGNLFPEMPESLIRKLWLGCQKVIEKLSLRCVDHIVCLGESLEQIVGQRVGLQHKVKTLSQGVDSNKFTISIKGTDFAAERNRLVFIGRIEPNKNLHSAMEAFEWLSRNGHDLQFDIYGEGSQRSGLEEVYGKIPGVRFHGEVRHEEIPGVLAKGGILLLPSTFEGNPNTVLEAMASGVFVIASTAGENRILLGEGEERGLLVESTSSEVISEKILFALEHPEFVTEAIIRARKYVKDNHSYEKLREKHLKILSK